MILPSDTGIQQATSHPARSRQLLAFALIAAYFVATSAGHLAFTLWLIKPRMLFSTTFAFKDFVAPAMLAGGAGILAWLGLQAARRPSAFRAVAAHWMLWAACVAAIDRFLTYSVYEYVHYPQYALLAWMIACALDPDRRRGCTGQVLCITTLLGMLDELMQYLWITPSYGNYLDFNDFLVNMLAAAAGLMLFYGSGAGVIRLDRPRPLKWTRLAAAACIGMCCLAAAFACGLLAYAPAAGMTIPAGGWLTSPNGWVTLYLQRAPDWYGSWRAGHHRGVYYILPPWSALGLMAGVALVFAGFPQFPRLPSFVRMRKSG